MNVVLRMHTIGVNLFIIILLRAGYNRRVFGSSNSSCTNEKCTQTEWNETGWNEYADTMLFHLKCAVKQQQMNFGGEITNAYLIFYNREMIWLESAAIQTTPSISSIYKLFDCTQRTSASTVNVWISKSFKSSMLIIYFA